MTQEETILKVVIDIIFTSLISLFFVLNSFGGNNPNEALSITTDNDMFSSSNDRDYSASFSIKYTKEDFSNSFYFFNKINEKLLPKNEKFFSFSSLEFGFLIFTPQDINSTDIDYTDRPYSNLVYVAGSKQVLESNYKHSWISTLSLGVLGTKIPPNIQNRVHKTIDSPIANGWDHQISNGGEPTVRYSLQRSTVLIDKKYYTLIINPAFSIGYLSDLSFGIASRIGIIKSNWYRYNIDPAAIGSDSFPNQKRLLNEYDFFLHFGIKPRVVIYNAFLQGQFRDSAYELDYNQLRSIILEGWVGLTLDLSRRLRLNYGHRFRTSETKVGISDRSFDWGSISLAYFF